MNTCTHFDFNPVAEKYDRCNHIFSLGIDHLWRKKLVRTVRPHPNQHVLDLCCGTGDVIFSFLKHSSVQNLTGVDISESMIDLAQEKGILFSGRTWMQNKHLVWKVADAARTGLESNSFDIVTCAFGIRNIPDRMASLKEISRVLKSRGKLCVLEFSLPPNPLLKMPYSLYLTRMMPLLGKYVIGSKQSLEYLARSIRHWHTEVDFSSELDKAGLKLFQKTPLSFGIATLWIAGKY